MSSYVVWLDTEHAHLHKFTVDGIDQKDFKRHSQSHHTHGHLDDVKNSEAFYHGLAEKLADADRILLIGPGLGKTHFKAHLDAHHHVKLASKVVGVETVDHPTDNQIDAFARKFFKKQLP